MKRVLISTVFFLFVFLTCSFFNTLSAQSLDSLSAFSLPANGCVQQHVNIVYNGNAPGDANYVWDFGGAVVLSGTGQGPYWVKWETVGVKTVTLTVTWNTHTNTTSHTIHIQPAPLIFHMTGGGSYPQGGAGVDVGLSGSESGRQYKLRLGATYTGVIVTGTGNAISFGLQTAAGSYNAVVVSDACLLEMEGSAVVTIITPPVAPMICMVSFDTLAHHNLVIWNKSSYPQYQKINIYRETFQNNHFEKIGEVSWSQPGTFLDTTANPLVKSDKYKISLVNLDGVESEKSPYHKTIHLNINPGLYGYNLIWNPYEGFEFLSYHIWRKIGNAPFEMIAGVASNVDSYTDFYTASGLSTYYIEVVRPEPCTPSLKSQEFASVISNPGTAAPLGIDEQEGAIILYPNPVKNKLEIVKNGIGKSSLQAEVFRVNGQLLQQLQLTENRSEIDLSVFNPGVYFIRISGENFTMVRKIIKE